MPRPAPRPGACQDCGIVHDGRCYLARNELLDAMPFVEAGPGPLRYEPKHLLPPGLIEQMTAALDQVVPPTHVWLLPGHPMFRNDDQDDGC